jgi:hypothetical protein
MTSLPNPPEFITFTGFDDQTSVERMLSLSSRFPIEWGILLSKDRQGSERYPSPAAVKHLLEEEARHGFGLRLAAHVCGSYAAAAIEAGKVALDSMPGPLGMLMIQVERIQINSAARWLNVDRLTAWAESIGQKIIFQTRGAFPENRSALWLFDASGGRGIEPKSWPTPLSDEHATSYLKGYAGGLNPENVRAHVSTIGALDRMYWLDMESGVRTMGFLDLDKVEQVCAAVYGGEK